MTSTRWHPTRCRLCDRHETEVGRISASGLCQEHGDAVLLDNVHSLQSHSGPAFERWRRGMAASVGAVFLDERTDAA